MVCSKSINCITDIVSGDSTECKVCVGYSDSRTEAVCSENGKKYSLKCADKMWNVTQFRIDGGVIKEIDGDSSKKCDYLVAVIRYGIYTAFFVELKGTDIYHALEQIRGTIKLMSDHIGIFHKVNARIVCSRCIPMINANPQYARLAREIKSRGGDLKIGTQMYTELMV